MQPPRPSNGPGTAWKIPLPLVSADRTSRSASAFVLNATSQQAHLQPASLESQQRLTQRFVLLRSFASSQETKHRDLNSPFVREFCLICRKHGEKAFNEKVLLASTKTSDAASPRRLAYMLRAFCKAAVRDYRLDQLEAVSTTCQLEIASSSSAMVTSL